MRFLLAVVAQQRQVAWKMRSLLGEVVRMVHKIPSRHNSEMHYQLEVGAAVAPQAVSKSICIRAKWQASPRGGRPRELLEGSQVLRVAHLSAEVALVPTLQVALVLVPALVRQRGAEQKHCLAVL